MNARSLVCLSIGLLLAAGAARAQTKDAEAILGTWKLVGLGIEGKENPAPDELKLQLIFTADAMRLDDGRTEKDKQQQFKYTIDPGTTPKIIDITGITGDLKGTTLEGIYQLDGDKLVICIQQPKGVKERPGEFATKEGSGLIILRLERVKP